MVIAQLHSLVGIPNVFHREQNHPNLFNASTVISYSLAKGGYVKLTINDMNGQVIYHLVDEFQNAGRYTVK